MKGKKMRIRRLKDGVLWIVSANDEDVSEVVINAGTWSKKFYLKEEIPLTIEERTQKSFEALEEAIAKKPKEEPGLFAHWECLGHKPGIMKHPFSLDYRCSNCGYESYWTTPVICPNCHALMKGEENDSD